MTYKDSTSYIAKQVDCHGNANYTDEENQIWHDLIKRQVPLLHGRSCDEFNNGLSLLNLSDNKIPQCPDISKILQQQTGWELAPVSALIPFDKFFHLLANKKFPAATFIRRRDELDYLREPDIFHEIFGHCPMLTNKAYADFTHMYGKLGLSASHEDQVMLARLYWFTVEFGLIKTNDGLRAYGGGILSSKSETLYCVDSPTVIYKPFDVIDVLRTPYRIDILQPIYFVIDNFDVLFNVIEMDLLSMIREARHLGMHAPTYSPKHSQPV